MRWTLAALGVMMSVSVAESAHAQVRRDTIRITHPDGGTWKTPRRLAPAGSVQLPPSHDGLGRVADIAVTPDGGVLVFDTNGPNGPTLLQFDARGKFIRSIGRKGDGPGEFPQSIVFGVNLAVSSSGAFIVHAGDRIACYDSAGRRTNEMTHRDGVGGTSMLGLRPSTHGFAVRGETESSPRSVNVVFGLPYARFSCKAKLIDSVRVQAPRTQVTGDRPFISLPLWTILEDGTIVAMRTDSFAVTIIPPLPAQGVRIVRVNAAPVRYHPAERKQIQAVQDWNTARGFIPVQVTVPAIKFPLTGMIMEPGGAFWLVRSDTSEPASPRGGSAQTVRGKTIESPKVSFASRKRFAGFLPDGTYRGDVILPITTRQAAFGAGVVWAVVVDDDGVEDVVRFVLPK